MKKTLLPALIASLCVLSGCGHNADISENSSGTGYVDTSEIFDKIDEMRLDIVFTDFRYSDRSINMLGDCTVTPDFIYITRYRDKKKIDLRNGRVQSICDIAGCIHDINRSPGCKEFETFSPAFAASDGLYFTKLDGKLYLRNGKGDTEVFENEFFTDLEAEYIPDEKTSFRVIVRGGIMYVVGGAYMYTVDVGSMEKLSEPVILSDSFIQTADVSGDRFWYSNENMELKYYNMNSGEIVKADDKVFRVKCAKNKVYYTKSSESKCGLYCRDIDGSNEILLLDNVETEFSVTDNSIYYLTGDGLFMCDKDGKNSRAVELTYTYQNGDEYRYHGAGSCQFAEDSACDSVFLIDYTPTLTDAMTANALFAIKKDSGEYRAISLGVYDTNGKVVTY